MKQLLLVSLALTSTLSYARLTPEQMAEAQAREQREQLASQVDSNVRQLATVNRQAEPCDSEGRPLFCQNPYQEMCRVQTQRTRTNQLQSELQRRYIGKREVDEERGPDQSFA